MADTGITATSDVTGKSKKKKTTSTAKITPNIGEQVQINTLKSGFDTNEALRKYQQEAAQRQLTNAMSTIDRSAMETYKAVADNYAARGMQRSGGYVLADDLAKLAANQQKENVQGSYADLLNQQGLTALNEKQQMNASIFDILQQRLGADMANKIATLLAGNK